MRVIFIARFSDISISLFPHIHTLTHPAKLAGSISTTGSRGLLLVHGLASNRKMWEECAMHLIDQGYQIASVDLRGHGESMNEAAPELTIEAYASDIASILTFLKGRDATVWENPLVIGQSWGGNIVLTVAHRYPDLVAGAVCVDGGFIDLQDVFPDWDECEKALKPPELKIPANILTETVRSWHPDWSRFGIEGMLSNFYIDINANTSYLRLSLRRHMAILHDLWKNRPREIYEQISVPILFLPAGSADAFSRNKETDIEYALTHIPIAEAVWFRDNCHDVHTENPSEVAAVIVNHMNSGIFGISNR
jgi:pimeloyl-ACP methyl ester carboxylesterase